MFYKDPFFVVHYASGVPILVRRCTVQAPFVVQLEIIRMVGELNQEVEVMDTEAISFDTAEAASEFVMNSEDAAFAFCDRVRESEFVEE